MKAMDMNLRRMMKLLCFGLAAASFSAPAALGIDTAKSKVTATFKQMGVPVEAAFTTVSGSVQFDPEQPELGKASIEIATASFDIGDDDYNAEVRKPEWFNSAKYPVAVFTSTALKHLSAERFQVSGELKLKGRAQQFSLPVTVKKEAAVLVFEGSLPISRKYFDIGDAGWADAVEDTVTVTFRIVQAL